VIILISALVGIASPLASAARAGWRGIVIAGIPVVGWLGWLTIAATEGITSEESRALGLSMTGLMIGMVAGSLTRHHVCRDRKAPSGDR
jgi:hypothetical protein